ncbi:MAG: 7-cyano-7-deazaguanine synthase [Clostridia bacterium]|nr:7-cyano-7-deazaguanine synthase [Clostridia bacterium]
MIDMILILDRSQEFGMEIARRLRAEQIYARIAPANTTAQAIRDMNPRGVILCGEAQETPDEEIVKLDMPVLALGRAAYGLLSCMGGAHADVAISEKRALMNYGRSALFTGINDGERFFNEAHTLMLPADVTEIANAGGCSIAFEDTENKRFGVQFDLERNDPEGSQILMNFVLDICGCSRAWTLETALAQAEALLAKEAARGGHAVCAISGGVDSTLCALLTHRAFGDRMTAIFVDTGLMREGEADGVEKTMESLGVPMLRVDRSAEILKSLAGKRTIEEKSAIVVERMYREMLEGSAQIAGEKTLVLGTNYSDFLESGSSADKWRESGMTVVEPLEKLFKDEIRAIGQMLDMSDELVSRKPFPALGLGARIMGEVTAVRLNALRTAECIFRDEIEQAGLERRLYKYFPVLIGGEAFGSEMVVLRAVTLSGGQLIPARLPYDLTERTVEKILAQIPIVSRVLCDQTPTGVGQESFY